MLRIRTIYDIVHGNISYTEEESKVMNHPLFLRLHHVCQVGLKRYVFPSASHTRFAHSVGAMHVTGLMIQAVTNGSERIPPSPRKIVPGMAVPFHELDLELRDQILRVARLAGLVHDLGHGPLSHAFEHFFPKPEEIVGLLNDPKLSALRPYRSALLKASKSRIEHETMSCILFAVICKDVGIEDDVASAVTAVLLHQRAVLRGHSRKVLVPWIPFITSLVSSAPADADRMDYLLRDSTSIGVEFGLFSLDRLLKSALCVLNDDGTYRLGWRVSGLSALEDIVWSRYQMFDQIYYHKTVDAIELAIDVIAKNIVFRTPFIATYSLHAFVESFTNLTDAEFLRQLVDDPLNTSPASVEIARSLNARKLWKCVYEQHPGFNSVDAKKVCAKLQKKFPSGIFHHRHRTIIPLKDIENGAALVARDRRGTYRILPGKTPWIDASDRLRSFNKDPAEISRVYAQHSMSEAEYDRVCQYAKTITP